MHDGELISLGYLNIRGKNTCSSDMPNRVFFSNTQRCGLLIMGEGLFTRKVYKFKIKPNQLNYRDFLYVVFSKKNITNFYKTNHQLQLVGGLIQLGLAL